jgi:general secretion pathway protein K
MACFKSFQSGIALLSAILITLTATAIIVSITHEEAFAIRKTSRIQLMDRAGLYALGLEDWARIFLQKDRKDSNIDHLGEDWAVGIPGLPIENGLLSGFIEDEQAKFNLNNLIVSAEWVKRFMLLCDNLEVDKTFVPALMDWIDDDFTVRYPDGAEEHYETYRVANRPMADISELLLVKNVDVELYDSLKPYITALPTTTDINVNTMSEAIYLSLGENLDAKTFSEERDKEEFSSVQDFIDRLQIPIDETGLSVTTEYFHAYGQVSQGDLVLNLDSLLHRDQSGKTSVANRSLGQL